MCHEWVSIRDHKCYIQPVVEEEEEEDTEDPTDPEGGGLFVANLLCHSSAEEEEIHVFESEDCALKFLHDLDNLVDVPDSDQEREIIAVFNNLKDFVMACSFFTYYTRTNEGWWTN